MNPFIEWEKRVKEKNIGKELKIFMEHYDIPLFKAPEKAKVSINAFFHAKYGMFYCQDFSRRDNYPDYHPVYMNMYEKSSKQQKRTWTMAVMAAIVDGTITYDDLKPYEK